MVPMLMLLELVCGRSRIPNRDVMAWVYKKRTIYNDVGTRVIFVWGGAQRKCVLCIQKKKKVSLFPEKKKTRGV
jgi:hypothetical protein